MGGGWVRHQNFREIRAEGTSRLVARCIRQSGLFGHCFAGLARHQAHQSLHSFAIDRMSLAPQPGRQAAAAPERVSRVLAIEQRHQRQVRHALGRRLVVVARPAQAQQFALLAHAQHAVRGIDPGALALNGSWQLFF